MVKNSYMDYTELELSEIARIIKEVASDDTAELKRTLKEKFAKEPVPAYAVRG